MTGCGLAQRRRAVRVLDLLAEAHDAYARGDDAAFSAAVDLALDCDAAVVAAVRGGMLIGEIPRPEKDPAAWDEYVAGAREALAEAEAAAQAAEGRRP